jgi:hypothetical protein
VERQASGLEDDLEATVLVVLKGLIAFRGVFESEPMAYHERRVNVAPLDPAGQRLDVAIVQVKV